MRHGRLFAVRYFNGMKRNMNRVPLERRVPRIGE
jgi:hypothetical protein